MKTGNIVEVKDETGLYKIVRWLPQHKTWEFVTIDNKGSCYGGNDKEENFELVKEE